MSNTPNDVVKEARAFIDKIGNCGLYPDEAQRYIATLCDEVERLDKENEELVDECGHWRAEAEHYAERPLEDI